MTPNNNLSVLPWYSDESFQNHRKSYAYGSVYPLFAPKDKLLPFQIQRKTREGTSIEVKLFTKEGNLVQNLSQQFNDAGLKVYKFSDFGYDYIVYPALVPFSSVMTEGQHYLTLSDGQETWFSEIFTVVLNVDNYLSIEWFDIEDFIFDEGRIVYADGFKNKVYICAELGKPEYVFEEEGETRDGYFFPYKRLSEKSYRFIFLSPEYLCDAMRLIRMSDYITITSNKQSYHCDTLLMTPKWQTQGDLASVEVEFQTSTVVKKIGRGLLKTSGGDFNNDYNQDFSNYSSNNKK